MAAAAAGAVLLMAPAAVHGLGGRGASQVTPVGVVQADEVRFQPKSSSCVADTENCITTKCCISSGHHCYKKDAKVAMCKKYQKCESGWDCTELLPEYALEPAAYLPGQGLYCFEVYVAKAAPSKTNIKDKDIIQAQFARGLSIFGCDKWDVFSDVDASFTRADGSSLAAVKVENNGDFYKLMRKDKPRYINTPIFYQVWKALRDRGTYKGAAWVVKVDPPTVFLPARLRTVVSTKPQLMEGLYFENCPNVLSGFFGNLEVTSEKAFGVAMTYLEECYGQLCWKNDDDASREDCKVPWKFGPWGEDKFFQECMDRHGVRKIEDFDLTISGTCPSNRPKAEKDNSKWVPGCAGVKQAAVHPFRNMTSWLSCLSDIGA